MIGRFPRPSRGRPAKEAPSREAGPEPVGPVLRKLLKDLRLEERNREGALASAWEEAAGKDLAGRARPVSFRQGLLTVEVEGAALLQEVCVFRARSILAAIRGLPGGGGVREIRFVPAGRPEGRGGP